MDEEKKTLRDEFALEAMRILGDFEATKDLDTSDLPTVIKSLTRIAYVMADAMMEARKELYESSSPSSP